MMTHRRAALLLLLSSAAAPCQTPPVTIPSGTPLALRIDQHLPMRTGQPIRGHLVYPLYADNKLLLSTETIVTGTVVELHSNRSRRIRAMLGGDFTPFHTPVVHFTQIILSDGTAIPLTSDNASDGTPIYRAVAPPPTTGGFVHRQFDAGLTAARSDVAVFTGPGKADRLLQFLYSQLPYHPQRIEKGTSWTVETTTPIDVPAIVAVPSTPPVLSEFDRAPVARLRKPHFWEERLPVPQPPSGDGAWMVQAYLAAPLSSESSKSGQSITAVVAEPILNPDHSVAVPQGATLTGTVTRAKPSRSFGRSGVLSFNFNQLVVPNGDTQTVVTKLAGADSATDIALNSEGQAKSKPQDKILVPLFLAFMASRPLDHDHHGADRQLGKDAVGGAAGLGTIGLVIAAAGGSPNFAAGIGYYGAARAFYSRWIARGQKITFAKDTRIVVQTTARRSAAIKPDSTRQP